MKYHLVICCCCKAERNRQTDRQADKSMWQICVCGSVLLVCVCSSGDLFEKKLDDVTQLISTLRATQLVGIVSLMYGILLHTDAPARSDTPPPPLPPSTVAVVRSAFNMLNHMARLYLPLLQVHNIDLTASSFHTYTVRLGLFIFFSQSFLVQQSFCFHNVYFQTFYVQLAENSFRGNVAKWREVSSAHHLFAKTVQQVDWLQLWLPVMIWILVIARHCWVK